LLVIPLEPLSKLKAKEGLLGEGTGRRSVRMVFNDPYGEKGKMKSVDDLN
jgi:hypothetical protein